jgi:hypothetical protein
VYGKIEMHKIFWSKELERGENSADVGVLLMITLGRILQHRAEESGLCSTVLEQAVMPDGLCKHDHEPSNSIKAVNFLIS